MSGDEEGAGKFENAWNDIFYVDDMLVSCGWCTSDFPQMVEKRELYVAEAIFLKELVLNMAQHIVCECPSCTHFG